MSLETDLSRKVGIGVGWTAGKPHPVMTEIPVFPAEGVTIGATTLTEARARSFGRLIEAKTTAGTAFGGTGANVEAILNQGSITIPANTLSVGDVVKVRVAVAIPTTVSTDELGVFLRIGGLAGTVLSGNSADVANDDLYVIDTDIVIRTATTGCSCSKLSGVVAGAEFSSTFLTALTGLDLTAAIVLAVTGVWSTQNANATSVQFFSAVVYGG